MELTFNQIHTYFEHRHPGQHISAREKVAVRCAFHEEKNASCTLYLDGNGGFNCHACGAKGNLFQFEARFSSCDMRQAEVNIAEITGATPAPRKEGEKNLGPPVALYDYRDESGRLLFQKRRYEPEMEGKTFRTFHREEKGWRAGIDSKDGDRTRRVLFNLPDLVKANVAFVCYSDDTEILTAGGWVRFGDLNPLAKVAQYHRDTEQISYVVPSAHQVFDYKGQMVNIESKHLAALVTPDHRMLTGFRKSTSVVIPASKLGMHRCFPVGGMSLESAGPHPTLEQMRVLVSLQADGSAPERGVQYVWNLKKGRKQKHLRELLAGCQIPFKEHDYPSNPGWIEFRAQQKDMPFVVDYLPSKRFAWNILFWPLAMRQELIKELQYWDGDKYSSIRYFTAIRESADIVAAVACTSGYGAHVRVDSRPERGNYNDQYVVNIRKRTWTGINDKPSRVEYNGKVYCCTVPSGFVIVRRNGKIFVAGNCEGEKDCINLMNANLFPDAGYAIACTTSFDGAWQPGQSPKWLDLYNPYFTGKQVFIFQDNDEPGQAYAETIAAGISRFAYNVRIVTFTEMPEKSDVSDFLAAHSKEELEEKIKAAITWKGLSSERKSYLVDALEWAMSANPQIEWLVDGIIQKDANGIIAAEPKTGKSLLALDLLISLSCGVSWLGRAVPRRVRSAYISREDSPVLTKVRIQALLRGKGLLVDPTGWLWCNTREQLGSFDVDDAEQVANMIHDLKQREIEFAVFDVLNRLHNRDENNNSEMMQVVQKISYIGQEAGCAIGLVHHVSKENGTGRFFTRIRGASAIHGWTEWSVGLSIESMNETTKKLLRRAEFETKAGESCLPISFNINYGNDALTVAPLVPKVAQESLSLYENRTWYRD